MFCEIEIIRAMRTKKINYVKIETNKLLQVYFLFIRLDECSQHFKFLAKLGYRKTYKFGIRIIKSSFLNVFEAKNIINSNDFLFELSSQEIHEVGTSF